jgi:hypothetical protein
LGVGFHFLKTYWLPGIVCLIAIWLVITVVRQLGWRAFALKSLTFCGLSETFGTRQLGSRTTVIGSQIAREKSIGVGVNGRYSIDLIGRRFGME